MADVEMKPLEEKKEEEKEEETPPPSPVTEIKSNAGLIERAVSTLEPRFTHRVLRTLTALRKKLNDKVLYDAVSEVYPAGALRTLPLVHLSDIYSFTAMEYDCRVLCEKCAAQMASNAFLGRPVYGC